MEFTITLKMDVDIDKIIDATDLMDTDYSLFIEVKAAVEDWIEGQDDLNYYFLRTIEDDIINAVYDRVLVRRLEKRKK